MNMTPEQMQRMSQIMRNMQKAQAEEQNTYKQGAPYQQTFDPTTGTARLGLLGAASTQEIRQMPKMSPPTDQSDDYYLNTRITDFNNNAELDELRRRINEREDFASQYYGS
jgi:hypothetical protein